MKVYNLNEITDSKVLYDKKPPALMKYVILIVTTLLIIGLVWANNSVKTYMVKGQGLVVTEGKSHIMAKTSGEIREVFIEEGKEVKAGDKLFTTNDIETNLQLEQVAAQIDTYSKRISLLAQAEENATNGTNYFSQEDTVESEFYNRLSAAYLARKEYEVDVEALKKQAVEEVESDAANQSATNQSTETQANGEEQSQIDAEQQQKIAAEAKAKIEADKKKQIDEKMKQIDDYAKSQKNKSDEQYYKTISEFTNEKKQYETELSKLTAQKDALEKSKEQYVVVAQKDGIVHLNSPLTVGMVLQGGTLIGTITDDKEELIVETMLSSTERPRIHTNDDVSLVVAGLNQAEYGTIPGKVISIDEDATIDNEKGNVYFKVKVKPEQTYLEDSKGEKVNLTVGMVTETRVKYEKITYMKYFLELIGVKFS